MSDQPVADHQTGEPAATLPTPRAEVVPAVPTATEPATAAEPAAAAPTFTPVAVLTEQSPAWPPTPGVGIHPPPLPPGFLRTWWPGPRRVGDIAVLPAVLAGALGFAAFLPLGRTGIGWFLAALAPAVGVSVVAHRSSVELATPERIIRALWGVAALALLAVLSVRNAWWLVTFCVIGALGCAALAIVGGRSIRSIVFSTVAAPFAAFRSLPWVSRHTESLRRTDAKPGVGKRFGWSLVVTVVLLLVFGGLFVSADAAFSELLGRYTPRIDGPVVFRWLFLFIIGALVTAAGAYLVWAPPDLSGMDTPGRRRFGQAEWVLPMAALVLLFAGFVVVQVAVLFGGRRHVLTTAGLSYAEYARSGFWQLVLVTMLTLLIISGMARWASRETARDRNLLWVLLGLLCTLSVVIVASALFRMYTYQQAYSFTGERIFVMAFEFLLGSIFILVMLAGIQWRGAWLPRVVLGLAVVMLLSLAALNPEQYAAERNVARYRETGKIDLWYLRALSADATPALVTLPDDLRRCTLSWISRKLDSQDPWYAWNLDRQQARQALHELGPAAAGDCKDAGQYDYPKTRD